MGEKQSLKIIISLLLIFLAGSARSLDSTVREWQSFTSFNQVREMVLYDGAVWVATSGGVVRIDPATMMSRTYINVDGLGMTQVYALYVDARNRLWVGGRGRLVNFTDPNRPDGYLLTDRDGTPVDIYDITGVPGGDSLWLADRLGLTLFLTSDSPGDGLILDSYSRFGELERDLPVRRVTLSADSVWVGTDEGLAVGSRHDIRALKAPTGWRAYFPSRLNDSLRADSVTGLVILRDTIYVGTTRGLYRMDFSAGPRLINIGLYNNPLVYNLSLSGDSLLAHTGRGSFLYYDGRLTEIPVEGMPIWNTTGGVFDGANGYWSGNLLFGVFRQEGTQMIAYDVGGTPSNSCNQVISAQGRIWGAFGSDGLAYYEDNRWHRVDSISGSVISLAVGPLGELWVGTFGGGVYRILGDSRRHFNAANSALSGIVEAPGFVVVPDINASSDAIWFADYRGLNGEAVAVNPYDLTQWQAFRFGSEGAAELMVTITAGQGVIYAGSENNGIFAVSYAGTPFYAGDDTQWRFTSSNSGIGSDIILSLRIDRYDTLWVGTAYGLSHQSLGEIYFSNITMPDGFGPEVTTITFDAQGSLYAGSGRGIAVRDIATGSFDYLSGRNSGLVDDDIKDIFYDRGDNSFWISTPGGISRLRLPYALAAEDVDNVLAYPNPFVINRGDETVRFNYAGLAEVRIFTLAGEMVREIPITGVWDGRNERGQPVASGLYIFTLTDREGKTGRGKIFLVRE